MQYQTIVGKMNEYLLSASQGLAIWLDKYLPQKDDWWIRYVLDKLSDNQKRLVYQYGWTNLTDLDLSALLRVADRNWHVISQKYFLNYSERDCLKEMFTVRNRWAHCSTEPIPFSQIIKDLETLKFFYGQIEVSKKNPEDLAKFLSILKEEGIKDIPEPARKVNAIASEETMPKNVIAKDSIVHLISDRKKVGVVLSVSDIGDTKKYDVFIDGSLKSYFAGQIELEQEKQQTENSDISDLLRTLTARQITCPSSNTLYSINSSRIDFVPYQFRPVIKLIKSDTPRLLIADSVGVGKTIEAGLILEEMKAREPLDIIVIICPKPLVAERKWEWEMKEKFGEEFIPADSGTLRQIIQDYTRDGVWDDRYKRLIIPYSILTKDLLHGVIGRGAHSGLENMDPPPFFDMVIVDEAHHVRNPNQAHNVVRFFCEHANCVLFLTATPIQLGNQDLFTLLNMLFPDIVIDKASFDAMAQPNEYITRAVKLLRAGSGHENEVLDVLRDAVLTEWGGKVIGPNPIYKNTVALLSNGDISREKRINLINDVESLHSFSHMINRTRRQDIEEFCVRRAYTVESNFTEQQKKLHDELIEFEKTVLSILYGNISAKFLMSMISRQAASCLFGLAPFIRDLVAKRLAQLFDEYDDELDNFDLELGKIGEMAKNVVIQAENLPAEDPKYDTLAEILKERQKFGGGKTIIFSTFRHTLAYLHRRIKNELKIRVEQVDGSVPDEDRFVLRERFALPKEDPNALDALLFSEVGAEGLDYQFCNAIVNYDLPWNPMRIEQRIGRIDRRGQKSEVVHIYNCITADTIDADIYFRCFERIQIFEKSLGECSDILGEIENSVKEIAFDPSLTEEERRIKLDKMMDVEVARIEENHKLEEEGKEMFGVDMSSFTDDIENAESPWISSNGIKRLIEGYLSKKLGSEKTFILDKRLKLSPEEKAILLDNINLLDKKNNVDKIWETYLRSTRSVFQISFSQEDAKDAVKSLFITPSHLLTKIAASNFSDTNNIKLALSIYDANITPGEYPFSIYSWEYKGIRPRIEYISICKDSTTEKELLNLIQESVTIELDLTKYKSLWDEYEERHFNLWKTELGRYKAEIKTNSDFKIASLSKSAEVRINLAKCQLGDTSDSRIVLMRQAQIERIKNDFEQKKNSIEASSREADIHTTLIVCGVLIVKGEVEK
jgi:ERCC4-related helicase